MPANYEGDIDRHALIQAETHASMHSRACASRECMKYIDKDITKGGKKLWNNLNVTNLYKGII